MSTPRVVLTFVILVLAWGAAAAAEPKPVADATKP